MGGGADSSGEERDAWEAVSIVLRIATVGMSLASAIMTFTSTECVNSDDGSPAAGSVSYSDYGSFNYSAIAELVSAVLEGVAIWLEVLGKDKWASTVEFIDKLVLALTSTSAPLLLAADNITSCGGRRNIKDRRLEKKLSKAAKTGVASMVFAATIEITKKLSKRNRKLRRCVSLSGSVYISSSAPPAVPPTPPPSPPRPPCPLPSSCSCPCPTVATPCCCENHGPCSASSS